MSVYRIWGAIVALVAGVLLVWTVVVTFGPEKTVVPTAAVTAIDGGGLKDAQALLRSRTEMQKWRAVSGPSPSAKAPPAALGPKEGLQLQLDRPSSKLADANQLVAQWQQDRPQGGEVLQQPRRVQGLSSLPYPEASVFEQPQGRDWRRQHNDQVRYGGGWLIFGTLLALAMFLAFRGRIPLAAGYSGERIERFNSVERANHWMTATSFIVMALTGLTVLYGKPFIMPLVGSDAYGSIARAGAWLHMAFAVPFVIGLLMMIVLWLAGNLPDRYDWPWIKQFGGFLNDDPNKPPAGRFNAGQKLIFWAVILTGLALLATGVTLMFPFYWFGYSGMQWAQLLHGTVALVLVAVIFAHIYIGTVGMEDAVEAMWSGKVDRNWVKEHHSVWYEKITGKSAQARASARRQAAE